MTGMEFTTVEEGPFDYDFTELLPNGEELDWPFAYCDGSVWRFDRGADTFVPEWRWEQ